MQASGCSGGSCNGRRSSGPVHGRSIDSGGDGPAHDGIAWHGWGDGGTLCTAARVKASYREAEHSLPSQSSGGGLRRRLWSRYAAAIDGRASAERASADLWRESAKLYQHAKLQYDGAVFRSAVIADSGHCGRHRVQRWSTADGGRSCSRPGTDAATHPGPSRRVTGGASGPDA